MIIIYPLVSVIAILALVFVLVNLFFTVARSRPHPPQPLAIAPWAIDAIRQELRLSGLLIAAAFTLWWVLVVAANHDAFESHASVARHAGTVEWSPRNAPQARLPDFSPSIPRHERLRR